MKIIKNGGHRLFENDPETARIVSEMLSDLQRHGMDAVRKYSQKFDAWNPEQFELNPQQIEKIIGSGESGSWRSHRTPMQHRTNASPRNYGVRVDRSANVAS